MTVRVNHMGIAFNWAIMRRKARHGEVGVHSSPPPLAIKNLHGTATFALGSGPSLSRPLALLNWRFKKREKGSEILVVRVMRVAEVNRVAEL